MKGRMSAKWLLGVEVLALYVSERKFQGSVWGKNQNTE